MKAKAVKSRASARNGLVSARKPKRPAKARARKTMKARRMRKPEESFEILGHTLTAEQYAKYQDAIKHVNRSVPMGTAERIIQDIIYRDRPSVQAAEKIKALYHETAKHAVTDLGSAIEMRLETPCLEARACEIAFINTIAERFFRCTMELRGIIEGMTKENQAAGQGGGA